MTLYSLLSSRLVTKSSVISIHDRSNIDNEFSSFWYLSRAALNLLHVWQLRIYCFTSRIISNQRWFLLNNLIVLFIFEWSNASWSCIFCIKNSRFDSNIKINSIACRESDWSNCSKSNNIWFCCFWRSFFLLDMFFARLIKNFAFSLNFSNRYEMMKWKSIKNCVYRLCRRFNYFVNMKYFKFLWLINILTNTFDSMNNNSDLYCLKHRTITSNFLS